MVKLDGWIYSKGKYIYSKGPWTFEIRVGQSYPFKACYVQHNGKERQIHLLYDNEPITVGSADIEEWILRVQEFLKEPYCVQKEIFNGNLQF